MSTPFHILGVNYESTNDEINQTYRTLTFAALKNVLIDHEPFYAVSDAYQVLTNPTLRQMYLERGEDMFSDEIGLVDAVDLLLAALGVHKIPFVTVPSFSIIMQCFKDKEVRKIRVNQLVIPEEYLRVLRRPAWSQGITKVEKLLRFKTVYSRLDHLPQVRQIQQMMDDYEHHGLYHVQEKLYHAFHFALGHDWMNTVGAVFVHKATQQRTKCRWCLNWRIAQKSELQHAEWAQEYIRRAQKLWRKRNLAYNDTANFFFLTCMLEIVREVERSLDKTLNLLFDGHKQTFPDRKLRQLQAQRLIDIGTLMYERDELITSPCDHMMAITLTVTAYHVIYVILKTKKRNLQDLQYTYPGIWFPDRHSTIIKIIEDARDLVGEERSETARQNAALM